MFTMKFVSFDESTTSADPPQLPPEQRFVSNTVIAETPYPKLEK